MGLGFTLAISAMATIREILGSGTWCGLPIPWLQDNPIGIMSHGSRRLLRIRLPDRPSEQDFQGQGPSRRRNSAAPAALRQAPAARPVRRRRQNEIHDCNSADSRHYEQLCAGSSFWALSLPGRIQEAQSGGGHEHRSHLRHADGNGGDLAHLPPAPERRHQLRRYGRPWSLFWSSRPWCS